MCDPSSSDFEDAVMRTLAGRLGIRINVVCSGDKISVTTTLIDSVRNREIAHDRDSDSVTIYQSDVR